MEEEEEAQFWPREASRLQRRERELGAGVVLTARKTRLPAPDWESGHGPLIHLREC